MNLDLTGGGTPQADDVDLESRGDAPSMLDAFRQAVEAKVERPSVTVTVPDRPTIKLRFSTKLSSTEYVGLHRRAEEITKPKNFTITFGVVLACLGLTRQSEAIMVNGTVFVEDGEQRTLRDKSVYVDLLGGADPHPRIDAIRRLYGGDEYLADVVIQRHWGAVTDAAGLTATMDDETAGEEAEDPTS